ncbi:MAG: glyoxalase-like protein [Phenylobacterium sp.]|nr:glyoxalase-like protein [Phenylobacterium sp.]
MSPRIAHISIYGTDLRRAVAFYRDVVGWPLVTTDEAFGYARMDAGAVSVGLGAVDAGSELAKALVGRHTGIGLEVADVDAAYAAMREKGAVFSMPPTRQPWGGYMAMFLDPDGNEIELQPDGAT